MQVHVLAFSLGVSQCPLPLPYYYFPHAVGNYYFVFKTEICELPFPLVYIFALPLDVYCSFLTLAAIFLSCISVTFWLFLFFLLKVSNLSERRKNKCYDS